jgi:hypothetical protein
MNATTRLFVTAGKSRQPRGFGTRSQEQDSKGAAQNSTGNKKEEAGADA